MKHPNALYEYLSSLSPQERAAWVKNMTLLIARYLAKQYGTTRPFREDADDIFQRTFERLEQHPELNSGRTIDSMELCRIFGGCFKYTIFSIFNENTVAAGTIDVASSTRKRRRVAATMPLSDWREDRTVSSSALDRPYSAASPEAACIMSEHLTVTLGRFRAARHGTTAKDYISGLVEGTLDPGQSTEEIARSLGTTSENIRKLRQRFYALIAREERPNPSPSG